MKGRFSAPGKPPAILLAHLNPFTKSHMKIISSLQKDYSVHVFPVKFVKDGREVNTKSFPFPYEQRREMVEAVFGSSVSVLPDYRFSAPYVKYLPPLLSPYSWQLRNQLVAAVGASDFVSYTGDRAERLALKAYGLRPVSALRLGISASAVKDSLYEHAMMKTEGTGKVAENYWVENVPPEVVEIIRRNWQIIERYCKRVDTTVKVLGMKFPRNGFF